MDLGLVLKHMYPNADSIADYGTQDDGDGPRIAYWNETKLGPQPTSTQLAAGEIDTAKAVRRGDMASECKRAIEAGHPSLVLGASHTYPTTKQDQGNLDALVLKARIHGTTQIYKFWCADPNGVWARRAHTAQQITDLGTEIANHVIAQQDRYETTLAEINAATTVTAVEAVVW